MSFSLFPTQIEIRGDISGCEMVGYAQALMSRECLAYAGTWACRWASESRPQELWGAMRDLQGSVGHFDELKGADLRRLRDALKSAYGIDSYVTFGGQLWNYKNLAQFLDRGWAIVWGGENHAYAARRILKSRWLWSEREQVELYDSRPDIRMRGKTLSTVALHKFSPREILVVKA